MHAVSYFSGLSMIKPQKLYAQHLLTNALNFGYLLPEWFLVAKKKYTLTVMLRSDYEKRYLDSLISYYRGATEKVEKLPIFLLD